MKAFTQTALRKPAENEEHAKNSGIGLASSANSADVLCDLGVSGFALSQGFPIRAHQSTVAIMPQ